MTSSQFKTISLSSIVVDRANRQRRELRKVDELAQSIALVGLINPPVVTRDFVLIAGERRLEACRSLGWTDLPVQFVDELDPAHLHLLELEENAKRLDLTWQEHNDAVAAYHKLRQAATPEWSMSKTAGELGLDPSTVSKHLAVAQEREADPASFEQADKFTSAYNIASRKQERRSAGAERKLTAVPLDMRKAAVREAEPAPAPEKPKRPVDILNVSFLDFAQQHQPLPFNLIHCDFPYGVNVGDKSGQGNAQSRGQYDDTPEVYFQLLECMADTMQNWCAPNAHLIFWFSMKFFDETKQALSQMGWRVDPFPLIWHKSDNAGIIPDANRGPRRTYETALFCSLGDRKIVTPVANSYSGPTTKLFHTSEKSEAMLRHFFRMVCDEHSVVLDPTCGSGMAIKVAESMGADYALGLELNSEYATGARQNLSL